MTKPNELREILDSLYISSKEGSATHEHPSTLLFVAGKDEAEAAILKWVDEVIGEDEPHAASCVSVEYPDEPSVKSLCDCGANTANRFRAEIRKRAGI